jgi:hypothetical protein
LCAYSVEFLSQPILLLPIPVCSTLTAPLLLLLLLLLLLALRSRSLPRSCERVRCVADALGAQRSLHCCTRSILICSAPTKCVATSFNSIISSRAGSLSSRMPKRWVSPSFGPATTPSSESALCSMRSPSPPLLLRLLLLLSSLLLRLLFLFLLVYARVCVHMCMHVCVCLQQCMGVRMCIHVPSFPAFYYSFPLTLPLLCKL